MGGVVWQLSATHGTSPPGQDIHPLRAPSGKTGLPAALP